MRKRMCNKRTLLKLLMKKRNNILWPLALPSPIQCLIKDANNEEFKEKMKGKSFALDPKKEEQKAFSATTIIISSAKPAKTHSVTRSPPSSGAVKDVDRKVIRRSDTHKEDTQRKGLKQPHANITTEEFSPYLGSINGLSLVSNFPPLKERENLARRCFLEVVVFTLPVVGL
ncbi:hypothetical protein CR513_56205, partial [Mucuna pruriens]